MDNKQSKNNDGTKDNSAKKPSSKKSGAASKKSGGASVSKQALNVIKSVTKGTSAEKGVDASVKASGKIKPKSKKRKIAVLAITFVIIFAIILGCYIYDTKTLKVSDFLYDTFYGLFNKQSEPKKVDYAEGDLIIHFVDVGQGDSIIIQFPDKKTMIIDGGPRSAKNAIITYIDNLGIKTFDYLLLTHSDEDHCGSLTAVIDKYEIKTIFMPDVSTSLITTTVYKNFVDAANKENAEIKFSDCECDFESENYRYKMDFVTPNAGDYLKVKKSDPELINSISPIMMLTFNDKKIMFTGDANRITENIFLENVKGKEKDYNVDILKVGHHGSETSSTLDFLQVVRPETAIIEVGKDNKYKHPREETLSRIKACSDNDDAAIYRTDLNGDIVIKITSDGTKTTIADPVLGKSSSDSSIIYIKLSPEFFDYLSCVFINLKKIFI